MDHTVVETDEKGTILASSFIFSTPRDLLKFAQLYLNKGQWDGQQILARGWVEQFLSESAADRFHLDQNTANQSVAQWWRNRIDPQGTPAWPHAPPDTFAGLGHWGQHLFIIPSRDAVLIRLGNTRDGSFRADEFVRLALAYLEEQ
jgi:CubicO group peptidase (beta-lactamase class C family)